MPAVRGANGGHRLAGIALIHGDDAVGRSEVCDGIPWRAFPERHRRAHAARRDQQDREALAMLFIVQLDIVPFEDWHVYSSPVWFRFTRTQRSHVSHDASMLNHHSTPLLLKYA